MVFVLQSGAIMAMIGIVCIHYPSTRLSVAFVDQLIPHSFSADSVSSLETILYIGMSHTKFFN